ncbi:hypothetical protein [Solilutibacter silvestris]|uniref:hypothetical protein n=1 Tax=Solilutibacter silvestris TaxID=1645665 RepID=UPI003D33A697
MNAEPDAFAAFPGVFGADALPQDCFGWPVMAGPFRVIGVMVVGVWCVRWMVQRRKGLRVATVNLVAMRCQPVFRLAV